MFFVCSQDYEETNSVIVTKIQFYAIELARNREGHNDQIRHNFKPKKRNSKGQSSQEEKFQTNLTQEVQHELENILGGNHPLMKWIKNLFANRRPSQAMISILMGVQCSFVLVSFGANVTDNRILVIEVHTPFWRHSFHGVHFIIEILVDWSGYNTENNVRKHDRKSYNPLILLFEACLTIS